MSQPPEGRDYSKRIHWGSGRVAFITQQERIQHLLAAGYPQRQIFQELEANLGGMSYSQFSHHIRKNLLHKKPTPQPSSTAVSVPIEEKKPVLTPEERGEDEKPKAPGQSTRFKPGPRIPDPSQLY